MAADTIGNDKLLYKNRKWLAKCSVGLCVCFRTPLQAEPIVWPEFLYNRQRTCIIMAEARLSFWLIDHVWVFYLSAAAAIFVFSAGVYSHLAVWHKAVRLKPLQPNWRRIGHTALDILTGRRIFKGDPAAGLMHGSILWGFLILFAGTVLVAVDHWAVQFLKGRLYLVVEFVLDIAGLLLFIGLGWALARRYLQRVARLEKGLAPAGIPLVLAIAALTGFLVEGCRLAAQNPTWGASSFIGWRLTVLWSTEQSARAVYPFLWWLHALICLGTIAYLPFTRLFHLLAAPVSVFFQDEPPTVLPVEIRETMEEVYSFRQAVFFDACTWCGRCAAVCPVIGAGEPFAPGEYILWARDSLNEKYSPFRKKRVSGQKPIDTKKGFIPGHVWNCTTCRACLEVCPVYAAVPEAVRQTRSKIVEEGSNVPDALTRTLKKVHKYNNPWEATKTKRSLWSKDLNIPDLTEKTVAGGLCYFVGCTTSMDTRAQSIARSFSAVLKHTGISFGTLGSKEPCCGDIARRGGEDGLFEINRDDCTALFEEHGISQVVTSSPHCFHTFRNTYVSYAALGDDAGKVVFDTRHYTQLLAQLVARGRLRFDRPLPETVTFHDPCYLGRYNRIFDDPRRVIKAIPGIRLKEMPHHGPDSLCCGGGGDRMWQEALDGNPKMSVLRIREEVAVGADLVITACPLCLIMLEDARKSDDLENRLRVMDLNELVVRALGLEETKSVIK